MNKKLLCSTVVFGLLAISIMPALASNTNPNGAQQILLDHSWGYPLNSGALIPSVGKVVYNVPNHQHKLLVTMILRDAQQTTTYTVGLNIFGACPTPFGGAVQDYCQHGYVSDNNPTGDIGIYRFGTITTDVFGQGSLHVNLNDLPSDTFQLVFWIVPCSPAISCGYYPSASTGYWNIGPFADVIIS